MTYLRFFTFFDRRRDRELEAAVRRAPEQRDAQRELAREVTRLVHGDGAVRRRGAARRSCSVRTSRRCTDNAATQVFEDVPSSTRRGSRTAGL